MNRVFKLNEIESIASDFLKIVEDKKVVGLRGELGAGKTTLTKELLKQLGFQGSVASPTFVLRRDYETGVRKVIHIDAYRLENPEQIFQVVGKDEFGNENNLVLIEWPDKASEEIFDIVFELSHIDEETRSIRKA